MLWFENFKNFFLIWRRNIPYVLLGKKLLTKFFSRRSFSQCWNFKRAKVCWYLSEAVCYRNLVWLIEIPFEITGYFDVRNLPNYYQWNLLTKWTHYGSGFEVISKKLYYQDDFVFMQKGTYSKKWRSLVGCFPKSISLTVKNTSTCFVILSPQKLAKPTVINKSI